MNHTADTKNQSLFEKGLKGITWGFHEKLYEDLNNLTPINCGNRKCLYTYYLSTSCTFSNLSLQEPLYLLQNKSMARNCRVMVNSSPNGNCK